MYILLLLTVLSLPSCKSRRDESKTTAVTQVKDSYLDLTTYKKDGDQITREEVAKIKKYSSDSKAEEGAEFYKVINKALRTQNQKIIDKYTDVILGAASLVNKNRTGHCRFQRYLTIPADIVPTVSHTGQVFIERAFFSSTENTWAPQGFEGLPHVIVGMSSNCSRIKRFSSAPSENEVLFPPGTEFEVVGESDGQTFYFKEIEAKQTGSGQPKVGSLIAEDGTKIPSTDVAVPDAHKQSLFNSLSNTFYGPDGATFRFISAKNIIFNPGGAAAHKYSVAEKTLIDIEMSDPAVVQFVLKDKQPKTYKIFFLDKRTLLATPITKTTGDEHQKSILLQRP